ncbi:MAG: elongation factor P maturation arginine rhamnosyltransferase EarP [Candidatus Accumulibacter sp.]|nr:elongation factor P maturation arginine rhamnosyltransferase EarP [Accumulibacter sp.]
MAVSILSRPPTPPVPPLPAINARPDWDVFCQVIDNFGDIGVCWRLSRQLASEYGLRVRLWVNDLDRFALLCPLLDPTRAIQCLPGIEVHRWETPFPEVAPAPIVLETFACRIPESFVEAMARRSPPPVWINLDYLSAEGWVPGCHTLPSPHPRLPLVKHFFFPGFTADSGGLLRERDLSARREQFIAKADQQHEWWRALGCTAPSAGSLLFSLFAYENRAISDLLRAWEVSERPICCLVPTSQTLSAIARYAGRSLAVGDVWQRGALEIRVLPFVEQTRYDQLLWLCDLNFVRGEDSFVRAQWAARPLVWQLYPQQDGAHLAKLEAFLALYGATLPPDCRVALHSLSTAWNVGGGETACWQPLAASLPTLRQHARRWAAQLAEQDDLLSRLLRFARSRL